MSAPVVDLIIESPIIGDERLENMPANRGFVLDGKKFYGRQPAVEGGTTVELFNYDTGILERWHRKGHSEFELVKCEDGFHERHYKTSQAVFSCREEMTYGECKKRFEPEHRKFHFHFCHYPARFHEGRPVCRYSRTDKDNLCWEKDSASHNLLFHHMD